MAKVLVLAHLTSESIGNTYTEDAKKHAEITVQKIREALMITTGHLTLRKIELAEVEKDLEYWSEVDREIEKV